MEVNNHISGLINIANNSSFAIKQASTRISTMQRLPGDDIVGFTIGNVINDRTEYTRGLLKSASTGVAMLNSCNTGLERIRNLLVEQMAVLVTATDKNDNALLALNKTFQIMSEKIDSIAARSKFFDTYLLDGTFGVDRTRKIRYPYEVNSVSIASKVAPVGPLKFLRDDVLFQPFESSAALVAINNVTDGDHIYVKGHKFTFKNTPVEKGDIKIQATNEENARRLITTILNSDEPELKRYAATNIGGGMLSIQSQIRSGDAVAVASSSSSIIIDNITAKADENVLNLHNVIDNPGFCGKVSPNFELVGTPTYDTEARNLAAINGIDLAAYGGNLGDSAAKYKCKIGEKEYEGVLFIRGVGGGSVNLATGAAGPEKGFLVMHDISNLDSKFTINFDLTYNGILDNQLNAEAIATDINDLFGRMTFKQNRYIAVNENPDSKSRRLFDVGTTTATVTNTSFKDLEIEGFNIYSISPTIVGIQIKINGQEYYDNTVPRNLNEGDRISIESDANNFVSITIGKGGLNLNNPDNFRDIENAFMTFFTGEETYHEIRVTRNNFENITTKIADFRIAELFKNNQGVYEKLSVLDNLERRKASIILDRASKKVLEQIAIIQSSIEATQTAVARMESAINISDDSYRSYRQNDLVTDVSDFNDEVHNLRTLIAVEYATKKIDLGATILVQGLSGSDSNGRSESE